MKKDEFLNRLEYLLQDIQEEDKRDAIDYYRDYLEEAGPEREEEVLDGFGSPEKVAAMIRTDLLGGMRESGEFTETGFKDQRFSESAYPCVNPQVKHGREADKTHQGQPDGGERNKNRYEEKGERQGAHTEYTGPYRKGSYADGSTGRNSHTRGDGSGKGRWEWWQYVLAAIGILIIGPFVIAAVFGVTGSLLGLICFIATWFLVLAILTVAGLVTGLCLVIFGIIQLFPNVWLGLICIGLGMLFAGAGLICLFLSCLFYGRFLPWLCRGIANLFRRFFGGERRESGRRSSGGQNDRTDGL